MSDNEIELYVNRDYRKNEKAWLKYRAFYEGDHDTLVNSPDYFWIHPKERSAEIADLLKLRKQRTRYLNIPEIILSIWGSFFFRRAPVLDKVAIDYLAGAENDIDGRGNSIQSFIKEYAFNYFLYGRAITLIDKLPFQSRSRAEEIAANLRPIFISIDPLSVMDWSYNFSDPQKFGKFQFIRNEYQFVPERSDETVRPQVIYASDSRFINESGQYALRRYTKETAENSKWALDGEPIITELTELPLVEMRDDSWLKDSIEETQRHFNLRSMKDHIEFNQGYQKIFIIGRDRIDDDEAKGINEYIWSLLPDGCSVQVIEPINTDTLKDSIGEALNSAFKVGLNQLRLLQSDSKAVQAEGSILAEKDDRIALVESTISQFQDALNQMLDYYAMFQGDSEFPGTVTLASDFNESDVTKFVNLYTIFREDFKANPEANTTAFKKALSEMGFAPDDLKNIYSLLEKGVAEPAISAPVNDVLGEALA